MRKTPSLFKRDETGDLIAEFNLPAVDWVLAGEGVATRKWDGTAMWFHDGKWWKRYDAKHGKPAPVGGIPCQEPDTGPARHQPFWVPVTDSPADQWLRDAIKVAFDGTDPNHQPKEGWSYEAVGPKIGGNPEGYTHHDLIQHGLYLLPDAPCPQSYSQGVRAWDDLADYLDGSGMEGIVWWRDPTDPNCEKVKITAAALGVRR